MKICDLTNGRTLHATLDGLPIVHWPAAYDADVMIQDAPEWAALIEAWQASPEGERLRATGHPTYQAASAAAMRCKGRFAP